MIRPIGLLAAVYTTTVQSSPWVGWVYVGGAIVIAVGLPVLLVVIARRSRWDR